MHYYYYAKQYMPLWHANNKIRRQKTKNNHNDTLLQEERHNT